MLNTTKTLKFERKKKESGEKRTSEARVPQPPTIEVR